MGTDQRMQNDIWDVLGVRSDVEELASELIDGRCDAAVISGPPGSGKTWLARQIAASFTTAGGVSFRGVGDETEANRRLFAMKCAQAETRGLFKPIAAVGKTILNVATRLATAGATGAEEAIDAFDAEKARRKRSVVFLDEDEQTILSEMGQDALRGPVLLIADNLHWWDKDSLTLLRMILDKRLAKAFPFTENIRILAVTTDESYQRPIWFEDYSRHVLPFFKKRLHLRYCRSNEMNSLKNIFDEDDILDQETLDFLFKLSGGHLAIFSSALNYLKEVDHKPNEKELQTLADDMFLERLRRIGSLGELADTFLSAASIVGNVFDRNEISCLLKAQSIPFHETVHTCQQLEFIEERDGRLEFRHDYIRRFFAARLGHKEPELREVFGQCLCQLTPGDYLRRGENYLKTRDQKKALDFCLLAAIKNLRKSRHPFHLFSDSARNLIVQFGFSDFISEIEECYRFLTTGNRLDAFALIEGWGIAYSEVILAEIEYLRSQFAINSRDVHERLEAIARLEGWRHYHDKEFEQWTRLMVLLRSALILDMDKRPARELDAEITRRMSERIHFDPDAEKVMHALGRSAEGLALPEIAIRRVARSEKFFRPKATRVSLDPPEHFRCLNNMAALNIAVGNYDNAEMFADEAIDLAGRFSNFVFPRRDFCHSLKVLAQFRKEMLSASEAAELQQSIISDFGVGSDPYYTRNYQAVYHCLAGDSEKAIALWSEMHESLLCHEEVEQNPYYFIASNLCAARYIREGDADIAIAQWDKLALSVEKIPYETRAILMQRHQVLRNVFERKISISSIEWDMYPIKMIARPLSSCWQELGRGFRMPDVQFWSMY